MIKAINYKLTRTIKLETYKEYLER